MSLRIGVTAPDYDWGVAAHNPFWASGDPFPGKVDYTGGEMILSGVLQPLQDLTFRVEPIPEPSVVILFALTLGLVLFARISSSNRLRGLVSELTQLLGDEDERWIDFGLKVPDDESLPEAPADLGVNGGAPGHLVAGWSDATRAERYRVYKQIVGVDNDFVLATTVADTDADMNTFTHGSRVRVKLTALNARGESQPSEVVEHQVP